jgi:hypothetical protein
MVGPYRLKKSGPPAAQTTGSTFQDYLARLMKMIPAEVIGLYLVGDGIIVSSAPNQEIPLIIWAVICIIAVIAVRIYGTTDPDAVHTVDWIHVAISAVAFVIWIYTLGGPGDPFKAPIYQPWIGSILVLVWTFFVPMFYRGAD